MEQLVRVSEGALREMVLATLEAYHLSRDKDGLGIEICGHLWGYHRRVEPDIVSYFVDSVSVSVAAAGDNSGVSPHPETLALKQSVIDRWAPHLRLLGEFHSHPYETLEEVTATGGFEFSDGDLEYFLDHDEIWECSDDLPLFLVMTLCRLQRTRTSVESATRSNIQRFDIGNVRFWLNACAGHVAGDGRRSISKNKRSSVVIDVFPNAYNAARDKLIDRTLQ